MGDTSRRTSQVSLSNEELGSFTNVDEIFVKYNISQIQQLTKKYKSVIDSTKTDLHNLVGGKYRDLIKIAEDIDDMYQTSNDIDSRIQQLSYKPTRFVSIYSDSYGKFDSYSRKQNALATKKQTRSIIVRNVINKKLNKLDQKIRSGTSPLIHTSNFIYYAKVYYTIETLFKDIIQKDESIRSYFYQLKSNLNDYLEKELSCYNLPESIVHTNDKFKPSQRLNTNDLVMNNAQILLQDDFDIDYDVDEEEMDDGNDDHDGADNAFEVDEVVNSKLESYDRNTSVISNYLISYTILNGGKLQVASKFVELRIAFIKGLLHDIKKKTPLDQVNFYQIFKFLEHTCTYVVNYFEKNSSDYHRILSHVTRPWNATTLIGHKVWIEDELINFDLENSSAFDRDAKFNELVKLVFDFTIESLPQETNKFEDLTLTVFVLHNFLVCLKRLQDSTEMSGLDSKLISVVSETRLLNDLLTRVSSFINSSYAKHASHLTSGDVDSLSSLIEKTLQSELDQTKSYQLFTPDLVNLMDVNAEKYISILSGEKQSQEGTDAIVELTEWFKECEQYNRIVKTETEDTRSSKLDAFRCVSHLHTYLSNVTWGDFQVKILDAEFKKLSDTMDSLLWEQIYKLLDFISKLSDSVTTADKIVYIIGIINQLKERISSSDSDASKSASESIDKLSDQLFERLVNDLPNESFGQLFDESIDDCINVEGNDIAVRPNLKITTVIYKLADEYLSVAQKSNNLDIFSKSKVKDNFIKIKNKWFQEKLIGESFISAVEKSITAKKGKKEVEEVPEATEESKEKEAENGDKEEQDPEADGHEETPDDVKDGSSDTPISNGNSTISKTQALAILASYTFLLHFHLSKVETKDTDSIVEVIKQHYNGDIEKSTLNTVVDGVASFYRSHKNIYLPLSVLE